MRRREFLKLVSATPLIGLMPEKKKHSFYSSDLAKSDKMKSMCEVLDMQNSLLMDLPEIEWVPE